MVCLMEMCRVMVRMKVVRKKAMMVVPRGQDMEDMSLVEEAEGFLLGSSCCGFAGG